LDDAEARYAANHDDPEQGSGFVQDEAARSQLAAPTTAR
jgi:hypothetical protein